MVSAYTSLTQNMKYAAQKYNTTVSVLFFLGNGKSALLVIT